MATKITQGMLVLDQTLALGVAKNSVVLEIPQFYAPDGRGLEVKATNISFSAKFTGISAGNVTLAVHAGNVDDTDGLADDAAVTVASGSTLGRALVRLTADTRYVQVYAVAAGSGGAVKVYAFLS